MRAPQLLLVPLLCVSCASPLQSLVNRAEQIHAYEMGWTPPDTSTMQDLQKRLKYAAGRINVSIVEDTTPDDSYGAYFFHDRKVVVRPDLALDAQVAVVAHEMAHALQPNSLELREREVFADAVAYLFTRPERDDLEAFAKYLGAYKTIARQVIERYEREIVYVAKFLRGDDKDDPLPQMSRVEFLDSQACVLKAAR